jgi:hypothetical protein
VDIYLGSTTGMRANVTVPPTKHGPIALWGVGWNVNAGWIVNVGRIVDVGRVNAREAVHPVATVTTASSPKRTNALVAMFTWTPVFEN